MSLKIIQLSKWYQESRDEKNIEVLRNISFDIQDGQFVSIVGVSGCGKSTLLKMLAGLIQPTSGTILVDEKPVTKPSTAVGLIFQEYALFPWRTALQNIEFGLEIQGIAKQLRMANAMSYINDFNLHGFANKYPKELSGGMHQRVAIARTLINTPKVILMDEPFGSLDSITRHHLQKFLLEIWQTKKVTILFVTHDVTEAVFLSHKVIVLSPRPTTISKIFTIDDPYPRHKINLSLINKTKEILDHLDNNIDSTKYYD